MAAGAPTGRDASARLAGASTAHPGTRPKWPTVAVLGNPNAGKTTVFNRLTGLSQKVGNYPGVTVEKKEGRLLGAPFPVRVIDLPGTYSLAAHSPDEMVAVDVLLGRQAGEERPDAVLDVVDATNLERNLYLYSQIRELGVPVVIGLNMTDLLRGRQVVIDAERLSAALGCPVVPLEAHRGIGIDALRGVLLETLQAEGPRPDPGAPAVPSELSRAVEELADEFASAHLAATGRKLHRFELLRALVDHEGHAERRLASMIGPGFLARVHELRRDLESGVPLPALEAQSRYAWVHERVVGCRREGAPAAVAWSERIDRILTHRVLGVAIFAGVMVLVFQSIFSWATPLMDWTDGAFSWLGAQVAALLPEGMVRSLIVDGVVAGVGAVVVFLPQILILFLFIGFLEDCGYMARAAFLMDRVMHRAGLSGKSFIPMLSGFACAIPGIMATRVIENRRDRIATIAITPLMSCSARLPVYTILIGTFIPPARYLGGVLGLQALVLFGLYALGIVVAIAMAWIFKRTLLKGETPAFVMELPDYKWPSLPNVLFRLYDRAKAFLVRAGTVILAIMVLVWALAYFPHPPAIEARYAAERDEVASAIARGGLSGAEEEALESRVEELEQIEAGEYLRQSFFGRMGHAVEPVFRPLGWDWKLSMAAIASFPAREVVVATLGTIYNLGQADEESAELRRRLAEARHDRTGELVFNVPVALSLMVFFALCCQCGATVATIRRETNSWGWAWFTFAYMTVLAYIGALLVYQVGIRL